MTEKEKNIQQLDTTVTAFAANGDAGKKPGLMRGARDFLENTWSSLKGKDLNQAVEEFTSEMTLVAEGLSEDQNALRKKAEKLSARVDELEQALAQCQAQNSALAARIDKMENAAAAKDKKQPKGTLSGYLKQATWLVSIACASWVLVTLLHLIGG